MSYGRGWAVALRTLLNLLAEETTGWIWSPLGATGKCSFRHFLSLDLFKMAL